MTCARAVRAEIGDGYIHPKDEVMTIPVLFRNHFQVSYIVRNIDGAVETMREKFGVPKWEIRRSPNNPLATALGFAYVQELMIELIEAIPDADSVFRGWVPDSDTGLRLHHLGYFAEDEADWNAVLGQFAAGGYRTALKGSIGDLLDYYYADTLAQLGHYTEVVHLRPGGGAYWANVPRN